MCRIIKEVTKRRRLRPICELTPTSNSPGTTCNCTPKRALHPIHRTCIPVSIRKNCHIRKLSRKRTQEPFLKSTPGSPTKRPTHTTMQERRPEPPSSISGSIKERRMPRN